MQYNLIHWEHLCQAGAGGRSERAVVGVSLNRKKSRDLE